MGDAWDAADEGAKDKGPGPTGTQTLTRGLDLIAAVAQRPLSLAELADEVGLNRSTVYRLAAALVEYRYLKFERGSGYTLGAGLLELGHQATRQLSVSRVARDHLVELAALTTDTVYLGVLDGFRALYLDKIPGSRRVEVAAGVGERLPLRSTGIGKALILDADEQELRSYYDHEARQGFGYSLDLESWLARMRRYAATGCALDIEEDEDQIRCVAAPIRDVTGTIVAAISVASAAYYMDENRIHGLVIDVKRTAEAISRELGYTPGPTSPDPVDENLAPPIR